jgi:hypothetical protein
MDNVAQTIISQYSTAPTLNRLISNFNDYIDPSADIDAFVSLIWDVDTAVGYGLDLWGRIVGVGRVLQVSSTPKFFGFNEASNVSADPFNTSPFYSGQQISSNFILADDGFRVLIFAKALANICDGSIPAINQILLTLFPGRGNCYIADGLNMTQTYTFSFHLTPVEAAIVSQSGILPRSTGVSSTMTAP